MGFAVPTNIARQAPEESAFVLHVTTPRKLVDRARRRCLLITRSQTERPWEQTPLRRG